MSQRGEVRRERVKHNRDVVQEVREEPVGFGLWVQGRAQVVPRNDGWLEASATKRMSENRWLHSLVSRLKTSCTTLRSIALVADAEALPTP